MHTDHITRTRLFRAAESSDAQCYSRWFLAVCWYAGRRFDPDGYAADLFTAGFTAQEAAAKLLEA